MRVVLLVVAFACVPAIVQQAPLTIHGRVFAADNRQALRHARVMLVVDREPGPAVVFSQNREHWVEGSRFVKVVSTSRDSSFRAASLPPGSYYVAAASNPDASTSPPQDR